MVEGHGVHRVAHAHKAKLEGRRFQASSPNGRFAEGAALIDKQPLARIEAIGKNLFYFFGEEGREPTVVHVHFGMSGAFRTAALPGPEPTDTTRLRLVDEEGGIVAHLSAMTCDHGGMELYEGKADRLGPDPLRDDADPERLRAKLAGSKKAVGVCLMDQSMVAGIGNIYRAEVLFKAGVHPDRPAASVTDEEFDRIWRHSVDLLQRGFKTGSIVTVDAHEGLPRPWHRRYVYNQASCGRCGSRVRSWDMAARTCYACETCQPRHPEAGPGGTDGGGKAVGAAAAAGVGGRGKGTGYSHCGDGAEETREVVRAAGLDGAAGRAVASLTVAQLKGELRARGLPLGGRKADLIARLAAATAAAGAPPQRDGEAPTVVPGTAALGEVASAAAAAAEKAAAGEGRNVEHVALFDDDAPPAGEAAAGPRGRGGKRKAAGPGVPGDGRIGMRQRKAGVDRDG